MAVIFRCQFGAFLDHYTKTDQNYHSADSSISSSCGNGESLKSSVQYRWKKELFLVDSPFMMVSQAERIQREMAVDSREVSGETSAQRKRRKKLQKNLQPSHHEVKISEFISAALPVLITGAREARYLKETQSALRLTSNTNSESRAAAQITGCEELFQYLCSEQDSNSHDQTPSKDSKVLLRDSREIFDAASIIGKLLHNPEDHFKTIEINKQTFIIPEKASFLTSDFHQFVAHKFREINVPHGYDLIVIDPPWLNKSVKRKKSYSMVHESDLKQIPIPALATEGCLVCVWTTNNEKLLHFVQDELFPHWSLEWVANWIWLKVTTFGETVCDLVSPHKKPYEQLIIGRYKCPNLQETRTDCNDTVVSRRTSSECTRDTGGKQISELPSEQPRESSHNLPQNYILVSVPCSLHSKKPPLTDVMSQYLPGSPHCLELFARNLMPGWTSWGNEPLRHQHMDYFEQVSSSSKGEKIVH